MSEALESDGGEPFLGRSSGFRTLVGHRCAMWREGYAAFVLDLDARHRNNAGFTHGGVYMTLLDAALSHAATWCPLAENERVAVTLSLTTSFLAAARGDRIHAIGRQVTLEGRIATCTGEVLDATGEVAATAQASFWFLPGSEHLTGVPRKAS